MNLSLCLSITSNTRLVKAYTNLAWELSPHKLPPNVEPCLHWYLSTLEWDSEIESLSLALVMPRNIPNARIRWEKKSSKGQISVDTDTTTNFKWFMNYDWDDIHNFSRKILNAIPLRWHLHYYSVEGSSCRGTSCQFPLYCGYMLRPKYICVKFNYQEVIYNQQTWGQ